MLGVDFFLGNKNRCTKIFMIAAAALFIAACNRGQESVQPENSVNNAGEEQQPESARAVPAPDFSLTALDGKRYKLSDLRGKVVFVNIWATWCPPCRQEIPSMIKFYNKMKYEGVEILAVSEDNDIEAVRKFIEKNNIPFPIMLDQNKQVYRLYKATGVPETHLISKEGMVEASNLGPFDWMHPDVENAVRKLLNAEEKGPAAAQ